MRFENSTSSVKVKFKNFVRFISCCNEKVSVVIWKDSDKHPRYYDINVIFHLFDLIFTNSFSTNMLIEKIISRR